MKLSEIVRVLNAKRIGRELTEEVNFLLTDSREKACQPEHTMFVALRTAKNDGARFVAQAYAQGVRAFLINKGSEDKVVGWNDATFIIVDDTLQALQQLAAYQRSRFDGPVIGITGSNGKTVVKEWLYALLKDDYDIIRSPKSYNSQIGVPLSVWQLEQWAGTQPTGKPRLAIFEAGISQVGEMAKLEAMIRPTLGVITYIGQEHGENFVSLEQKRAEKMRLFAHCEQVIEDPMHQNARTCAMVLRALGYDEDTISRRILQQTHETVLQVNLSALVDNVRHFRGLLRPQTKLTCMVKAFAYGTGSVEISRALQQCGMVDYLAVAVADEGVELRKAGITLPIIVMDPEVAAMDLILENNLEPNVYSFQSLEMVMYAAAAKGLENYPVHIKIDSGMHRLGFYREEIEQLGERLLHPKDAQGQPMDRCPLRVKSIFSHLAGSDEAQFDAFTLQQIRYYDDCAEALKSILQYPVIKHICNSAGIERFADYQFDMCRLGIGLYGFSFAGASLRNVCTLKTTLLSVKTVKKGETIGYGRHTTLTEDRKIGVIPIGYADGFDRRFSNYGGEVLVRGKRCPVVGNVCMDQAMVDITGTDAQVGDYVEVFGDNLPLMELSDKLHTIPYELLTSVSRRVTRTYVVEN